MKKSELDMVEVPDLELSSGYLLRLCASVNEVFPDWQYGEDYEVSARKLVATSYPVTYIRDAGNYIELTLNYIALTFSLHRTQDTFDLENAMLSIKGSNAFKDFLVSLLPSIEYCEGEYSPVPLPCGESVVSIVAQNQQMYPYSGFCEWVDPPVISTLVTEDTEQNAFMRVKAALSRIVLLLKQTYGVSHRTTRTTDASIVHINCGVREEFEKRYILNEALLAITEYAVQDRITLDPISRGRGNPFTLRLVVTGFPKHWTFGHLG